MPVFEKLEPPAGGLVGLRDKMEHSQRRTLARAGMWMMVPALGTAALLLVARPAQKQSIWDGVQNPALVRLGMQPAPSGERVQAQAGTAISLVDGVYWLGGAVQDEAVVVEETRED